jgi:hypothetical protein
MTRKHFVLIAQALNRARPLEWDTVQKPKRDDPLYHQWRMCVVALTSALSTTNPRFVSERFIRACEGE